MNRWQKKIQRRINSDMEEFDVWYEKNGERFPEFERPTQLAEVEPGGAIKIKPMRYLLIPAAFLLIGLCLFLCFFHRIFPQTPTHFSDDSVYNVPLTETEQESIIKENEFLTKFNNTVYNSILKIDDASLVFIIVQGELETEEEYYFVKVQIEYNEYYDFIDKPNYEALETKTTLAGNTISYALQGLDPAGLCWYYMLTEKDGQRIYWEIHCLSESVEEFLEIVF